MTRKRRYPRFGLGTLLWFTVTCAVAFGWWRDHRRLKGELAVLRPQISGTWGVHEATGPPNTWSTGDIPSAWASATPDGQQEWLLLDFPRPVRARAVVIHETYNPGAVYRVTAFKPNGSEVVVWQGTDPTPVGSGRRMSNIPLRLDFRTARIRVHIDSVLVPGWNEIDAVGLRDSWGRIVWAEKASASSSYDTRTGYVLPLTSFAQGNSTRLTE